MIKKMFLFPHSAYLTERWWHRLATVIFWFWLVLVFGSTWYVFVVGPYLGCKKELALVPAVPGLDCGPNAIALFAKYAEPGDFALLILTLYLLLVVPGLLYRLVLHVATGSRWKDAKPSA